MHALVYPNGRKVRVGQKLRVRLASVNLERRQLDFDVVAFAGERPSRRRGGAERLEVSKAEQEPLPREQGLRPGKQRAGREGRPGDGRGGARPGRDRSRDRRGDRAQRNAGARPGGEDRRRDARRPERTGSRPGPGQPTPPAQRRGAEIRELPGREPTVKPGSAELAASAHPGFDRLRALAEPEHPSGKRRPGAARERDRGQVGAVATGTVVLGRAALAGAGRSGVDARDGRASSWSSMPAS